MSDLEHSNEMLYLTFDDGPHETVTPAILRVLREERIRATFFVVGRRLESLSNQQALREAVAAGHCIGNHTFTHPDLTTCSEQEIADEMMSTAAVLGCLGVTCRFFRPPYGRTNKLVAEVASRLGLQEVLWDNDPRDWARGPHPDSWVDAAVDAVHKRSARLILCHDIHANTSAYLRRLIVQLRGEGYRFATLEERETETGEMGQQHPCSTPTPSISSPK